LTILSIILVEDDAVLCDLLTLRLTKLGYKVKGMYSSGEEAIRSIPDTHPDLILMDINLSGKMDGIETAHYIQKKYKIPVVYLTASSDAATFERAKITDECEYILKPFSDHDLYIAIEMAYYKYTLHRKIKSKEKFLEKLVLNMGDAIICTDSEGFISLMNPAAEALIATQFKSERKVHLLELVTIVDESGREIENPINRITIDMEAMDLPQDALLVSKEAKKVPVKGSVSPLKDEKGKFGGVIVVISPISRSKTLRYSGKMKF
jgi:CheY-like chemotaxis protein